MTRMFIMDEGGGGLKVLDDVVGFDFPFAHVPAVFPAGERENSLASGIVPGLDVPFGVPDEERLLRVGNGLVQAFERLAQQAYAGLAAIAASVGTVGAVKTFGDLPAGLVHVFDHVPVNAFELAHGVNALTHAGLVGNDKDLAPALRQSADRFQSPGDKMKILHLGHVTAVTGKFIDDAVSI